MTVQREKVDTVVMTKTWWDVIVKSLYTITISAKNYTLTIAEMLASEVWHFRADNRTNLSPQYWNKSIRELKDWQIRNTTEVKRNYTTHQRNKTKSLISWLKSIHNNFTSSKFPDFVKINKSWEKRRKRSKRRESSKF